MVGNQLCLFENAVRIPEGMEYWQEFLPAAEEARLAAWLVRLPFAPFEFHGFTGNRRVLSFGWRYVFDGSGLARTDPIPEVLRPLRARAAERVGLEADALEHVLLTEYTPGAGIGWHKDRSAFGDTIGLSLLAPCRLRFRRKAAECWDRLSLTVEPRSLYLLRGPSRHEWEHSIAPMGTLRYSITFRTLAQKDR